MLEFKQFTAQAMVEIRPLLAFQKYRSCDYSVGGIFMWRDYFDERYTVRDNMLIGTSGYFDEGTCYTMPVGTGSVKEAVRHIKADAQERGSSRFNRCREQSGSLFEPCAVSD